RCGTGCRRPSRDRGRFPGASLAVRGRREQCSGHEPGEHRAASGARRWRSPAPPGGSRRRPGKRAEARSGRRVRVWIDISAPAHVLVFRPLLVLLRERGDGVEITTRDYAQTLELLERHEIDAEVIGAHGGRSRVAKAFALPSRLRALRGYGKGRGYDLA